MSKARRLRELLKKEKFIVVPGVYDALTARIAHYCGSAVIYMTGYGTSALYGYPYFGLLTMSEMTENVRRISDAFEIPLIAEEILNKNIPQNRTGFPHGPDEPEEMRSPRGRFQVSALEMIQERIRWDGLLTNGAKNNKPRRIR